MKESTLLKLAFTVSSIGIISMWLISGSIEPDGNELRENSYVKVKGTISRISETDSTFFIGLETDKGIVDVVVFKNGVLELNEQQGVEINGRVAVYNGKKEIIAERIKTYR
ncbi:hypothetical protein JXA85_06290 [Candidatus Woesearchaeota archaeon]|nr:hypothetical protein [Candidatus Woesearchaeota archaeon]